MTSNFNTAISAAAIASWAVPTVAAARAKRYAATVQSNGSATVEIFKSVPAALRALGVQSGWRTIRAAARDSAFVELEVNGSKFIISSLEVN